MSAVLRPLPRGEGKGDCEARVEEPSAKYLAQLKPAVVRHFDLLAESPGGVPKLREFILTLAVEGKLVPQDPIDEPAQELLKKVRAEKDRLIAEGRVRRDKLLAEVGAEEQPFPLPRGWEWARIGHLINASEAGWSPTCIGSPRRNGAWGVLKVSAVSWGAFDADANKELPAGLSPRPEYEVRDGDFLMSRANTEELVARSVVVGKVEPRLMLSDKIIRLDVSSQVNRGFLNYCNNAAHSRIHYASSASGTSSSMKNVSREVVLQTPVPLPPLAEQTRIVTRVEELMRLCDALEAKGGLEAAQHARLVSTLLGTLTESETPEALVANWQRIATHFDLLLDRPDAIDALEQTILQLAVRGRLTLGTPSDESGLALLKRIQHSRRSKRKVVTIDEEAVADSGAWLPAGWCWASIDQISADFENAITDGPFGANLKTEHYLDQSGFRVIRLQNIGYGEFRDDHRTYIDKVRFEKLSKHTVNPGDLVVAGLVDTSIRCCEVPEGIGPAVVKADCYRLSVHEYVSAQYVLCYLSSKVAHEFAAIHHHGLTLTRIGLGNFRSIPIPLPPFAEQSRIVARVDSLRRLCVDLRQRLCAAQATQAHLGEVLVEQVA